MNTNEGNYCLRSSKKISQTLKTFTLGFWKKNKEKGVRNKNKRVFFAEGVVSVFNVLGSPFCDRKWESNG